MDLRNMGNIFEAMIGSRNIVGGLKFDHPAIIITASGVEIQVDRYWYDQKDGMWRALVIYKGKDDVVKSAGLMFTSPPSLIVEVDVKFEAPPKEEIPAEYS